MKRYLDNLIFAQQHAADRLRWMQITLGFVYLVLHLGTFSTFRAQLTHPIGVLFFPDLMRQSLVLPFLSLKTLAAFAGLAMAWSGGLVFTTMAVSAHAVLAWADYSFFPQAWNYISHLLIFGVLIWLYEWARDKPGPQFSLFCSALFSFALLTVGLIYFQAFLAKLMQSGWEWFLTGNTVKYYTLAHGTAFGKKLAQWAPFGSLAGMISLIIEVSFLPLIILGRQTWLLALCGIGFHLGIWIVMGISFWHLWIFYPALFLDLRKAKDNLWRV